MKAPIHIKQRKAVFIMKIRCDMRIIAWNSSNPILFHRTRYFIPTLKFKDNFCRLSWDISVFQ